MMMDLEDCVSLECHSVNIRVFNTRVIQEFNTQLSFTRRAHRTSSSDDVKYVCVANEKFC